MIIFDIGYLSIANKGEFRLQFDYKEMVVITAIF